MPVEAYINLAQTQMKDDSETLQEWEKMLTIAPTITEMMIRVVSDILSKVKATRDPATLVI